MLQSRRDRRGDGPSCYELSLWQHEIPLITYNFQLSESLCQSLFPLPTFSMSSQPDYVVVDDTQLEEIKYSSGWIETNFSSSVGNTGPPLYQTLHVAMSPANFTFTYNGEWPHRSECLTIRWLVLVSNLSRSNRTTIYHRINIEWFDPNVELYPRQQTNARYIKWHRSRAVKPRPAMLVWFSNGHSWRSRDTSFRCCLARQPSLFWLHFVYSHLGGRIWGLFPWAKQFCNSVWRSRLENWRKRWCYHLRLRGFVQCCISWWGPVSCITHRYW